MAPWPTITRVARNIPTVVGMLVVENAEGRGSIRAAGVVRWRSTTEDTKNNKLVLKFAVFSQFGTREARAGGWYGSLEGKYL